MILLSTSIEENDLKAWREQFQKEIDNLKALSENEDSKLREKIDDLESTLKTSLGFVQKMVEKEILRSDILETALEEIDNWKKQVQQKLESIQETIKKINDDSYNRIETMVLTQMDTLKELMLEVLKIKKKKTVDTTKVISIIFGVGSVGYLIIQTILGMLK